MFAMDQQIRQSLIVLWNWRFGREILRLIVPTRQDFHRGRHRGFDFLSKNTLVVCRAFDPADPNSQSFPEHTFGFLDIYQFDPLATASMSAKHITTLVLPFKKMWEEQQSLIVYFSSSLYTPAGLRPQVWELSPENRILCISVDCDSQEEHICVSARVLLEYAHTIRESPVPWGEWGVRAYWDEYRGIISRYSNKIRTHGSRLISMEISGGNHADLSVFELSCPKGASARLVSVCKQIVGPDSQEGEDESLWIGPLSVVNMDDENVMVFRETVTSDSQTRDLLLITR